MTNPATLNLKPTILYVEDIEDLCKGASRQITAALPEYGVVTADSFYSVEDCVRDGLQIENLALVCTDGSLADHTTGWQVAGYLRNLGYHGPILYTGGTSIPDEKKHLFYDQAEKYGPGLIDAIKRALNK